MNEADICRVYVTPKLRAAGWTDEQIREQVTFTHDRIVSADGKVARKVQKRADYLLYFLLNYKLAMMEAKGNFYRTVDGLQAKVNMLPAHFLGRLQVKGGEELSALMASILDKAFKGEL